MTKMSLYVDMFEQAQKLRLETMNRMRCWLRDTIPPEEWPDKDFSDKEILKEDYLPNDLRGLNDLIMQLEKDSIKFLKKEIVNHELWPYLNDIKGIDVKIAGRLLHHLGDLERFPSPAHLWSYCGLDGPGWRKRPHNWTLTSICFNIAESFVKQRTPKYREIYDIRKEYEATKPPCEKCKEKGFEETCRPAHLNNKARRYAVKEFLKDLWIYART